jgi:nicotinamide-nucleotide amidase
MSFYILSTGTELTTGRSRDSNGPWIASRLSEAGLQVRAIVTLPDDPAQLEREIRSMLESGAQGIVMTGGLGPTADDYTVDVLASIAESPVVEDPAALAKLEAAAQRMPDRLKLEAARRQTRIVSGSRVLPNERGLAPGMMLDLQAFAVQGQAPLVAAMPGVPSEMTAMFESFLFPELKSRFAAHNRSRLVFYVYGMGESQVQSKLFGDAKTPRTLAEAPDDFVWGITAHPGFAKVFFETEDKSYIEHISQAADSCFGSARLSGPVEELLHDLCVEHHISLSFAESCTGGLVSRIVTDRPGSSDFFRGALVVYANDAKQTLAGVSAEILREHGAVSQECALALARGAAAAFNTDAALSITGIAGPGGGTRDKPVGTVHCAAFFRGSEKAVRWNLPFDRDRIREYSARASLFHLYSFLKSSL